MIAAFPRLTVRHYSAVTFRHQRRRAEKSSGHGKASASAFKPDPGSPRLAPHRAINMPNLRGSDGSLSHHPSAPKLPALGAAASYERSKRSNRAISRPPNCRFLRLLRERPRDLKPECGFLVICAEEAARHRLNPFAQARLAPRPTGSRRFSFPVNRCARARRCLSAVPGNRHSSS